MNTEITKKLWDVATHASTNENEAYAAFSMLRKKLRHTGYHDVFFNSLSQFAAFSKLKEQDDLLAKAQLRYNMRISELKRSFRKEENSHLEKLQGMTDRAEKAERALESAQQELSKLTATTPEDELGLIARRDTDIQNLLAKIAIMSAEMTRLKDDCSAQLENAENKFLEKILSAFAQQPNSMNREPINADVDLKYAEFDHVKNTEAQSSQKFPDQFSDEFRENRTAKSSKTHYNSNRGKENEKFVYRVLTSQWKSIGQIHKDIESCGATVSENAIRFAAKRLAAKCLINCLTRNDKRIFYKLIDPSGIKEFYNGSM